MTTVQQHTCAICGESETDPGLLADCSSCGVFFHLNPRNDIEGIDCGDVWAGDCDQPVLQFFCNTCLARVREEIGAQGFQPLPVGFGGPGATPPPPVPAPPAQAAPSPPPARSAQPPERPRRRFRRIDGP